MPILMTISLSEIETNMKPLYQLVEQHRELERLADLEEIDRDTLLATLEGLQGEITAKAQSACAVILNLEAWAQAAENAARDMEARAERMRNKAEWLRAYVLGGMKATGITKIESPEFRVSIRKNPAAVSISPDAVIPDRYLVQPPAPPPRPDKTAIKAALAAGEVVPGCMLIQGERLEIK